MRELTVTGLLRHGRAQLKQNAYALYHRRRHARLASAFCDPPGAPGFQIRVDHLEHRKEEDEKACQE